MMNTMIDKDLADSILEYARGVLEAVVTGHPLPQVPDRLAASGLLQERMGAFSTLKMRGELRGCIGAFAGRSPLGEVLPRVVRESALEDRRFPPVRAAELDRIEQSISLLFPAVPVSSYREIVLGRDGVIITDGVRRAVFLPEVAPEQGWNVETMLTMLCRKAGLSDQSWMNESARLEVFLTIHLSRTASGDVAIEGAL